jgi:hypothetical protein
MRKTIYPLAVSIVAVLGLAGQVSPAAAAANSQCPAGKVCLYDGLGWNSDLSGSTDLWSDITGNQSDLRRYFWHNGSGATTGQSVQDDITSIKNRTNCVVSFYVDTNYGTGGYPEFEVGPGESRGDLSAWGMNNKISSVAFSCPAGSAYSTRRWS